MLVLEYVSGTDCSKNVDVCVCMCGAVRECERGLVWKHVSAGKKTVCGNTRTWEEGEVCDTSASVGLFRSVWM